MEPKVIYTKEGDLGIITLNDPEKGNPIGTDTMRELHAAFKTSASNGDRVVLYMAKGAHFTVGENLKDGFELISNPTKTSEGMETIVNWQELTSIILSHPGIIIVGYHGWVIGGGFEHTLWCDFKIAARNTTFMLPELNIGLFFSNASTKLLPQLVGLNKAKEIMLLGDKFGPNEAKDWGIVHQICDDDKLEYRMRMVATKLLEKDPLALKYAKQLLNSAFDHSIQETLYEEWRAMLATGRSEGCRTRIEAFVKKSHKK